MSWRMKIPTSTVLIASVDDAYLIGGPGPVPLAPWDPDGPQPPPPPPPPPPPSDGRWPEPLEGEDVSAFIYPGGEPLHSMESGDRVYASSRYPPGAAVYFALDIVGNPGGYRSAGQAAASARTDTGRDVGGMRCWVSAHPVEMIDPHTLTPVTVVVPPGYIIRRLLQTGRAG